MNAKGPPATIQGRSIGITILVALQLLIGVIHLIFGALLLSYENFAALPATAAYDIYTIAYGTATLIFVVYIWRGSKIGLIGTIAVSAFVIAVDSLAVLNLPTVPGAPRWAAWVEIPYSLIISGYLLQPKVRKKFV